MPPRQASPNLVPIDADASSAPQEGQRDLSRTKAFLLLGLLMVIALGLRLYALDFLLPCNSEPDKHILAQARQLRTGSGPFFPAYGAYPHLIARILTLLPPRGAPPEHGSLQTFLSLCSSEVLQARTLLATISIFALPAFYAICRFFCRRSTSLLACFFFSFSLLHFLYSQQARPHAAAATFMMFGMLGCLHLLKARSIASYILAGIAVGLAVNSLQTNVFLLLSGVTAHWLASRSLPGRAHLRLFIPVAIVAGLSYLLYPFLFASRMSGTAQTDIGTTYWPHRFTTDSFNGKGAIRVLGFLWHHDPLLLVLAALGLLVLVSRRIFRGKSASLVVPGAVAVVLAHALPFLVLLAVYERTFARIAMPLLPYISLLAAVACSAAWRGVRNFKPWPVARMAQVLVALVALVQTVPCLRFVQLKARPDTMEIASEWIPRYDAERPEPVQFAITPWLSLPLHTIIVGRDQPQLQGSELKMPWFKYQHRLPADAITEQAFAILPLAPGGVLPMSSQDMFAVMDEYPRILDELDPDYCILQPLGRPSAAIDAAVRSRGKMIRRIMSAGWQIDNELLFRWPYVVDRPLELLFTAERLGPGIEIYDMRRGPSSRGNSQGK